MGKQRKQFQKKVNRAMSKPTATERITARMKDNPFEKRENFKTKHQVHNRRVKGHTRNMIVARSQAIDRRKKTLLVEYEDSKKANSFKDRRFGEGNENLSAEDKMLMRLTAERKKDMKKRSLFNLNDSPAELTHGGMTIGDDYKGDKDDIASSDDDDAGVMNDPAMADYMFGGGKPASAPWEDNEDGDSTRRKSKREILEEIIAKSKIAKAEKKKNKAAQDDQVERLDDDFQDIAAMLQFRPQKGASDAPPKPKLDAYDRMSRELAFETRAKAQDRTQSEEELAMEEKYRLEKLEKKRLKRMREWAEEDDSEDAGASGEEEDDGEDEEEEEDAGHAHMVGDGKNTKSRRGVGKIGGSGDSLEGDQFTIDRPLLGPASESDEEEDDSDEEDTQKALMLTGDHRFDGDEEDDDKDLEKGDDNDDDDSDDDSNEDDEDEDEEGAKKKKKKKRVTKLTAKEEQEAAMDGDQKQKQTNAHIPFVFECPVSINEYRTLVRSYALSPRDETVIIDRICKCHSVKLGGSGKTKAGNRKKLGAFVGVLLKRIEELGRKGGAKLRKYTPMIDWLAGRLFKLAWEIPTESAQAFGTVVKRLQRQLRRGLAAVAAEQMEREKRAAAREGGTDEEEGEQDGEAGSDDEGEEGARSCLPSGGQLLLLRLVEHIFPCTDKAHVVVTPARLVTGQILSHSAIVKYSDSSSGGSNEHIRDLVSSLMCCASLLGLAGDDVTGRMTPEVLSYLTAVLLHCAVPHVAKQGEGKSKSKSKSKSKVSRSTGGVFLPDNAREQPELGWVAARAAEYSGRVVPSLRVAWIGEVREPLSAQAEAEVATAVLGAACGLAEKALARHMSKRKLREARAKSGVAAPASGASEFGGADCPALPELFGPLLHALKMVCKVGAGASTKDKAAAKGKQPKAKRAKTSGGAAAGDGSNLAFPPAVMERLLRVTQLLQAAVDQAVRERVPLRLQQFQPVAIASLNPRFEEDYTYRKDLDPDRQRAQLRQLKRQVKREHKGAIREIKRDAQFLAGVKWQEQEEANSERRRVWHENAIFQEQQEQNWKQQTKDGGGLMKEKPGDKFKSRRGKTMKLAGSN